MKLSIFGATGATGLEVVLQAMAEGHQVKALVRDQTRMTHENPKLSLITGDVLNPEIVEKAVQGQDAVICCLGSKSLSKTSVRADGTANIIKAMGDNQIERLILVSAMGVGESWSTLSFFGKLIFATLLRASREDHEKQEAHVKKSDLNWTIVRPSGLTDEPKTGEYLFGEDIHAQTQQIARADVADFILKELVSNTYSKKAVTITN